MQRSAIQSADSSTAHFRTTRWSLVVTAGDPQHPGSRDALAELCRTYWYPLYAFVRRRGVDDPDRAADLVQGFFCELIAGRLLRLADPAKGRFRSYILGAVKHFMSAEHSRARAQKRGGGVLPISLSDAETRYGLEPSHDITPERLFERRWALTLLDVVVEQLRREYVSKGRQRLFDQLKQIIAGPLPDRSYVQIAAEVEMSEGAVKVAAHRLRRQYRKLLREQIAQTVLTSEQVEDEIRHLRDVVSADS